VKNYYFSFPVVRAVKKPLIIKKFWFSVLALLENNFIQFYTWWRLRKFRHHCLPLHSRYRPISDIIFKQQIRKVYVKVNKKDLKLLHTLISSFSYKSLLKNTQFYVF